MGADTWCIFWVLKGTSLLWDCVFSYLLPSLSKLLKEIDLLQQQFQNSVLVGCSPPSKNTAPLHTTVGSLVGRAPACNFRKLSCSPWSPYPCLKLHCGSPNPDITRNCQSLLGASPLLLIVIARLLVFPPPAITGKGAGSGDDSKKKGWSWSGLHGLEPQQKSMRWPFSLPPLSLLQSS